MKSTITHLFLMLAICMIPGLHYGQIVIDYENFPKPESYEVLRYQANPVGIDVPISGVDMEWDYANLEPIDSINSVFFNAEGNTVFPNAKYYTENNLLFLAYFIESSDYEGLDQNGVYGIGRYSIDTTYSITNVTGGPNDRLRFVGGPLSFDGRFDYLKFPMTYGDSWTQDRIEDVPFLLTVAAFGLNQVPGNRKRITTQTREITGWGNMVIPNKDGEPNMPQEVLQMRVERVAVDSFFLGGEPAPPQLLAAFGLTQGSAFQDQFYLFFNTNDQSNIMRVNVSSNGSIESLYYKPEINDMGTSVKSNFLAPVMVFPNPVAPAQTLTIQTEAPVLSGRFELSDLNGRTIFSQTFDSNAGSITSLQMPYFLLPGTYIFQLLDSKGTLKSIGKLNVQ